MDEDRRRAAEELERAGKRRATAAWTSLTRYLRSSPFPGADALRVKLARNPRFHITALADLLPMCKAVEQLVAGVARREARGQSRRDLMYVQHACAILYILLLGYEEIGAPSEFQEAIDLAHGQALRHYLRLAADQCECLCRYLLDVAAFIRQRVTSTTRIIVVEMPVGNSLPVKLLHPLMEEMAATQVLRVLLSRNDSKKAGVKRVDLLAEKLREVQPTTRDIVLYIDEWNTGANFRHLCDFQKRVLPADVRFLPAAFLTSAAPTFERYASHCEAHDRLVYEWSCDGRQFRRVFPSLGLPASIPDQFFWSEWDRMAGYRKMQAFASVFGSFDDAVRTLQVNPNLLRGTVEIFLTEMVAEGELEPTPANAIDVVCKMFLEAYDDYVVRSESLRTSGAEFSSGGEVGDYDTVLEMAAKRYSQLVDDHPAKRCVIIAITYLQHMALVGFRHHYTLREHAPILVELRGLEARPFDITMSALQEQLAAIQAES